MLVRLFSDGSSYVQGQTLPVTRIDSTSNFIIPLSKEQVDLDSISSNIDMLLSNKQTVTVTKGPNIYGGTLVNYNDMTVTILSDYARIVIKDYDEFNEIQYIVGKTTNNTIPSNITVSYVTRGITGRIVHKIVDNTLTSNLVVSNNTPNDIVDAQFEVTTAKQQQPAARYMMETLNAEVSQASTPTGTIYKIDGQYDVPAGYQVSIPIIVDDIDIQAIYTIDAPNGTTNATYTLEWISPVDLPAGTLYIYRENVLESVTDIDITGKDQSVSISLVTVPSVFAKGTITKTDRKDDSGRVVQSSISLKGTITNSLPNDISVQLRYYIGTGSVLSVDGIIDSGYIIFPYDMSANSSVPYSQSFSVSY